MADVTTIRTIGRTRIFARLFCRPLTADAGTQGFSLVEVLVVLAILAGAATLIAAYLPAQGREPTVKQTAQILSAHLRRARTQAITSRRKVNFVMDVRHHRFWIEGVPATQAPLPARTQIDTVTAKSHTRDGLAWFGFFPDGTSTGGSITLHRPNQQANIAIDWMTGMAYVATK